MCPNSKPCTPDPSPWRVLGNVLAKSPRSALGWGTSAGNRNGGGYAPKPPRILPGFGGARMLAPPTGRSRPFADSGAFAAGGLPAERWARFHARRFRWGASETHRQSKPPSVDLLSLEDV
jgi:hypothetical protein